MTAVALEDFVVAVQALYEHETGRPCHFHLFACAVCGGPSFQYPCPCCRSWADASDTVAEREKQRAAAAASGVGSRESFVAALEKAGGLGPWYFESFRNTTLYREPSDGGAFRAGVDRLVGRARSLAWPDAGAVWDAVRAGHRLPHDGFWGDKRAVWHDYAAEQWGAARAAELVAARSGQWSWPENGPEGRETVAACAETQLAALGLSAPSAAAAGPRR